MIKTLRCEDTQALFAGKSPRKFKPFTSVAERKLQLLDDAYSFEHLSVPPGNSLKTLRGNRSIRINDQTMHSFHRSLIILIFLLLPCVTAHAAQFAEVGNKKGADLAEVVKNVERSDVIFIGEIHYNPQHHKAQLDIIRSLHAKKLPVSIGLEMFTPEDQQKLDDWTGGKLDEESFLPIYSRNWSYGWQLYRELFIFARDNRIPLIALNTPKPLISKVMAQGPSALQESEIPPKISWTLNASQADYMRTIAVQVFGNNPPEKYLARLSEAQALRNSGMAWNIARYKQKHTADRVVVLAGIWHAVKHGVPELLAKHDKLTYKVIVPELAEFNLENATVGEADYLIMKSAH